MYFCCRSTFAIHFQTPLTWVCTLLTTLVWSFLHHRSLSIVVEPFSHANERLGCRYSHDLSDFTIRIPLQILLHHALLCDCGWIGLQDFPAVSIVLQGHFFYPLCCILGTESSQHTGRSGCLHSRDIPPYDLAVLCPQWHSAYRTLPCVAIFEPWHTTASDRDTSYRNCNRTHPVAS